MALAELLRRAGRATATCTTTRSRASHPLWCGPLGYQGSKAAMKLIAQADVVLALGSRLGPFGTLPQHGIDYWPKDAKIIQIDADPQDARAGEEDLRRHLRRREGGGARARRAPRRQDARLRPRNRDARLATLRDEKGAWEKELDGVDARDAIRQPRHDRSRAAQSAHMHPRQVLRELEKAMPDDAMVSTDIGNINSVVEQLPALRGAALDFRRDELRQLRLRVPDDRRRQGRRAGPAGDRLRRRRRVGHELRRDHDLRARRHSRHRRGVQQPPVGRGEEEPGRLLQAAASSA